MVDEDREIVAWERRPISCEHCGKSIEGTPWAFPLMDMRFDERLRFCSSAHLNAYRLAELKRRRESQRQSSTERE